MSRRRPAGASSWNLRAADDRDLRNVAGRDQCGFDAVSYGAALGHVAAVAGDDDVVPLRQRSSDGLKPPPAHDYRLANRQALEVGEVCRDFSRAVGYCGQMTRPAVMAPTKEISGRWAAWVTEPSLHGLGEPRYESLRLGSRRLACAGAEQNDAPSLNNCNGRAPAALRRQRLHRSIFAALQHPP